MEVEADDKVGPRKIRDRATVVAVDAFSRCLTQWSGTTRCDGEQLNGDVVRFTINGEGFDTKIRIQG